MEINQRKPCNRDVKFSETLDLCKCIYIIDVSVKRYLAILNIAIEYTLIKKGEK